MIDNPSSFYHEAQFQRVCAVCGGSGPWDAHHVVSKARLKRMGLPLWDVRNALRLCDSFHMNRENGGVGKPVIPTEKLLDCNICFIWDALGPAGQNYLERHYTGVDRRYTLHTTKDCPTCQRLPQTQ